MPLRLGLGLGAAAGQGHAAAVQPPGPPTAIVLTNDIVDEAATVGTVIGHLLVVGGTAPYVFGLESDPESLLAIEDGTLELANGFSSAFSGPTYAVTIGVTDARGLSTSQAFSLEVTPTPGDNQSGIGEGDGDIVIPPGDGGFEDPPVQQDTSTGLKIAGKNGGSATFFKDLGAPEAGDVFVMKYSADWSGMSKMGRQAAVGFAFKQDDLFHLVALRGNGSNPTTMLRSKIHGDFTQPNRFTITNDGAAAHGSKNGPNWLMIEIASDGATYTLSSSADGDSWSAEYTAAVPVPLGGVDDALQFGPGGYFTNQDKGVFSITIETFEGLTVAPAQFATGDWSVTDKATDGAATVTVSALPDDGGSVITDIEYQVDGSAWVSSGLAGAGSFDITGLTNNVEVDIAIRAVNAIGNGTASATKAVTPTESDEHFASVVLLVAFDGADAATSATDDSNSSHTLTFAGNAQIDTAQSKFGGASLLVDGTGDYVSAPDSADWDLSDANSDQFTIEGWIRQAGGGSSTTTIVSQTGGSGNFGWWLESNNSRITFNYSHNGTAGGIVSVTYASPNMSLNEQHHFAVDKDATGKIRLYVDGVMRGSATPANSAIFNSTGLLNVGAFNGSSAFFNGHVDELRITKGVARYASDSGYTVRTTAFPRS